MTRSAIVLRPIVAIALSCGTAVVVPYAGHSQIVQPLPSANDPVERLGRYIRVLAASPRDLTALLGAGQAALDVGDPNAALGFFARADDISPGNGRVKAGLGSSLVMIEKPDDALRLFAEAVSLGVPEATIARDRGLAYDLRGDPKRAQRDYALAATRGADDELRRRHALSLGIAGDRAAAIAMLDPLLRRQDQGAWRARAFILAMTGDVAGANGVARQLMVPAMASAMAPLLTRIASLNAAGRAHAVNFGTVPSDGTQLAVRTGDPFSGAVPRASLTTPPFVASAAAGSGLIPAGEPLGPRAVPAQPARVSALVAPPLAVPREVPPSNPVTAITLPPSAATLTAIPNTGEVAQPGFSQPTAPVRIGRRVNDRIGPVATSPTAALVRPIGSAADRIVPPVPSNAPLDGTATTIIEPVVVRAAAPAFEAPPLVQNPPPPPVEMAVAQPPVQSPPPVAASRLAGLLEGIERETETAVVLPSDRELRTARAASRRKVAELAELVATEAAAKRERDEQTAAAKRSPARIWVQVATGRNESGLGLTWRRLRDDNVTALKGQTAWSVPYRATNRIVVGPMKSAAAARELVGKLAKGGVQATTWSSAAGEDVERIATR